MIFIKQQKNILAKLNQKNKVVSLLSNKYNIIYLLVVIVI
jgi:hypothetical protein